MKLQKLITALTLVLAVGACNSPEETTSSTGGGDVVTTLPDTSNTDPKNPAPPSPTYTTDVLLFNGVGISTSDWQNTEKIIKAAGLSYQLANSTQLNAMSLSDLTKFGTMVFPGGYGNQITNGLSDAARLKVRQAVQEHGVGYVGFCAGAWVAVDPVTGPTKLASYGFGIAAGAHLTLYRPNGTTPTAAIVDTSFPDGSHRDLVWWGGPITPEWTNGVVARYKTGDPAISQTFAGKGFVVISGPHPEAPQGWRATAGTDSDGLDYDIALDMIEAAMTRKPLPTF